MELTETSLIGSNRCCLAIDPGLSGAVAKVGCGSFSVLRDFKHLTQIGIAIRELCVHVPKPTMAIIEHVHAMPEQGVCSMFSFGEANGAAKAALALELQNGAPVGRVEPQQWQGFFRQTHGIPRGTPFDSAKIARQIFPTYVDFFKRKKDHNSGDAVLMAVWGLIHAGG